MLKNLVRWIISIFRSDDQPEDSPSTQTTVAPEAPPRKEWLRWPLKLRIFGVRRDVKAAPAPADEPVEPADWDGILDSLFWSGYTGTGNPEEMLQRLRKMQDTAVDATRVEYFLRETALRARLDAVAEERRQDRADEPDVRARIERLQAERGQGTAGVQRARERLLSVHAKLMALRHTFPVRQIQERIQTEAALSQKLAENVVATEAVRASAEDALMAREIARRERAGPAMAEWEAGHRERVRVIREHSERQNRVTGNLRASGMTAGMASFFIWAGYVGMVIFGWRLGEVLHERAFPNASSLQGLIAPLAQTAYLTFLEVGPRVSLWAIGGFLTVWLLGSFLIFFLFDRGLPLFDRHWRADEENGAEPAGREMGIKYTGILSLMKARVSRNDYAHYLARTPLMAVPALLGLLALLFFAMGGQRVNAEPEFVNPINSLLFGLYGFAMAAALTGCVALLLQPFLAQRASTAPSPSGTQLAVPAVGFAVLVLLTLVFAGGLPQVGIWSPDSLVGPVLMIALNAVMLSHGLVYRHIFRDWQSLHQTARRLEDEHWEKSPYSLLAPQDLKPLTLFERWNQMHEEVREAWKAQDAAVTQVLDDLPGVHPVGGQGAAAAAPGVTRRTWWIRATDRLGITRTTIATSTTESVAPPESGAEAEPAPAAEPTRSAPASVPDKDEPRAAKPATWSAAADPVLCGTRVTVLDGRLEPELTADVVAARAAYHNACEALDEVKERLADAEERLREIESRRLDKKYARIEGELERLTAERAAGEAEVEARYAALRQEGASAHEGGRQLAERLSRVTSGTIRL